jgi:hypothetical protein
MLLSIHHHRSWLHFTVDNCTVVEHNSETRNESPLVIDWEMKKAISRHWVLIVENGQSTIWDFGASNVG